MNENGLSQTIQLDNRSVIKNSKYFIDSPCLPSESVAEQIFFYQLPRLLEAVLKSDVNCY